MNTPLLKQEITTNNGETNNYLPYVIDMTQLNANTTDVDHKTQVETGVSHSRRIVDSAVEKASEPTSNNDPSTQVEPIIGYAQEPLLPLIKACEPLSHI